MKIQWAILSFSHQSQKITKVKGLMVYCDMYKIVNVDNLQGKGEYLLQSPLLMYLNAL